MKLKTQLTSSYKWILELAEYKAAEFPCLEEVTIREKPGCPAKWERPEHLSKAFEMAQIHLVIRVGVPVPTS
jgi:hypothetical protein